MQLSTRYFCCNFHDVVIPGLLDSQGVQRRRRPRQAPPKPPHVDAITQDTSPRAPRATIETNIDEDLEEFDETAYLAGKVEVLGNSTEKKMPRSKFDVVSTTVV